MSGKRMMVVALGAAVVCGLIAACTSERGPAATEVALAGGLAAGLPGAPGEAGTSVSLTPYDELWIIPRDGAAPSRNADEGLQLACEVSGEMVPLPVVGTEVEGQVQGFVSTVRVVQRYQNPYDEKIEAVYTFPLPSDAAVRGFEIRIGDRRIRGVIAEREEAKKLYIAARSQGHVASLMEQVRPNVFTQRVANIEPGRAIDVAIDYLHSVSQIDGEWVLRFPTVVGPRYNPADAADPILPLARGAPPVPGAHAVSYLSPHERGAHTFSFSLDLDAGARLGDVRSPTHRILVERRGAQAARVRLSEREPLDRDLVVTWRTDEGSRPQGTLLVESDASQDAGTYALLLHPPRDLVRSRQEQPLELIFVLDVSGSMSGTSLDQARAAMLETLRHLDSRDRFQIVTFASGSRTFAPRPLPATGEVRERAEAFIRGLKASGGTEMEGGLRAALRQPATPECLRYLVFMTDGYIGNEARVLGVIGNELGNARVFSFATGSAPNGFLLDRMARLGRGALAWLGSGEDGARVMRSFFDRVRTPALCDIELDFGPARVSQASPARLPDLLAGRPVALFGRWRGRPPQQVEVRGRVAGQTIRLPLRATAMSTRDDAPLAALWARRRIHEMNDGILLEPANEPELAQAIESLALRTRLLSPYTSFLAVDSLRRTEGRSGVTVPHAVPVPQGTRYETTVGNDGR